MDDVRLRKVYSLISLGHGLRGNSHQLLNSLGERIAPPPGEPLLVTIRHSSDIRGRNTGQRCQPVSVDEPPSLPPPAADDPNGAISRHGSQDPGRIRSLVLSRRIPLPVRPGLRQDEQWTDDTVQSLLFNALPCLYQRF